MSVTVNFSPPALPSDATLFSNLKTSTVLPGPAKGSLVPPQLWDGSQNVRDPKTGNTRGNVYVVCEAATNGTCSYKELWVVDKATIDQDCAIVLTSVEPVNFDKAKSEASVVASPMYLAMQFQYLKPIDALPASLSTLSADWTYPAAFHVNLVQSTGAEANVGRMLRMQKSGVYVDHWLLGPNFFSPSVLGSMKLVGLNAAEAAFNLRNFLAPSATSNPFKGERGVGNFGSETWRYVQCVYKRSDTFPEAV